MIDYFTYEFLGSNQIVIEEEFVTPPKSVPEPIEPGFDEEIEKELSQLNLDGVDLSVSSD